MGQRRDFIFFILAAVFLGVAGAVAMVIFLNIQYAVTAVIWDDPPYNPFFTLFVTSMGGLLVGGCLHFFGDHVGLLSQTMAEFRTSGRFEPKYLPGGLLSIFLSLVFGASLGPEVAAIDMGGGMGTWLSDRIQSIRARGRVLSVIGLSGSLAGFGIVLWITSTTAGTLYPVPAYQQFVPVDLLYAALLGLFGGAAGIAFVCSYRVLHRFMTPLSGKPVLRGVLGGAVLGMVGIAAPLVLFSGQTEFQIILKEGAALGAAVLLLLVVAKIFASTWCMATVFKGGPIFPLIFAGGTLGMAVNLLLPFIPSTVAITAVMAGMIVCILKTPTGVILFLILIFLQWGIVLVVIVATLAGYLLTKKVTMLPKPFPGRDPPENAGRSDLGKT
jgi:H+/Cl- antiporter ClcA